MIETHNIYKQFNNHLVLDNVSCRFFPGKTNLVIGESGSGKTTLIKLMIGLYTLDKGDVKYDGRIFNQMSEKEKRKLRQEIGVLFQGGALFDFLTVEENIMFPLIMFKHNSMEENLDRVNFCLKRVNLEGKNNMMPSELSGGMTKRVAIARAISMNPRYLLCDEPNSGLDPKSAILIDNLIKEITEEYNITTVINTHDMNSVMEIGDYISYIHNGKIWWQGNTDDLTRSNNKELDNFVFASNLFKRIKK